MVGMLGNLLGMGAGAAGGRTKGKAFRTTLNNADFTGIATADKTTVAGTWTEIGYFTVPAQTTARVGFGNANLQINQGFIYFRLDVDTAGGTQVTDGSLRLVHSNAEGTSRDVVFQESLTRLSGSQTDRNSQIPIPEVTSFPVLGEDSRLILEVKTVAARVIDYDGTNTIIRIPVTRYL